MILPSSPFRPSAEEWFGCSALGRGLWLAPDGETILRSDGTLWVDEDDECWGCSGAGVVKVYLHRRVVLAQCEICQGTRRAPYHGAGPPTRPAHVHNWQETPQQGPLGPAWFRRQECECGARWYRRVEQPTLPEQRRLEVPPWPGRVGRELSPEAIRASRGVTAPERLRFDSEPGQRSE